MAVVRMAVGGAGAVAATRLWANGWLDTLYAPPHRLAYPGLEWVPALDGTGLRILAAIIIATGAATALGWHTRLAAATLAVAFSWLEFIEATTYLNHYWFISSMAALLAVVPAGADLSLDAARAGVRSIPAWALWSVRTQVAVVYVFGGVAKLSSDWMVEWLPLRLWLPARSDLPVVGPLLADPAAAALASWAGAAFDLGVVWFLLWRRTRPWAWGTVVAFHVITWVLFPSIGIFPWVMIAVTTVFFAPDWPRRLLSRPAGTWVGATRSSAWTMAAAAALLIVQVGLPLRHFAGPGDPRWTGEGFRFAWNVLAVEKTGALMFRVTGPDRTELMDPATVFTPNQMRLLPTEPQLVLQAAHIVAGERGGHVSVYADSWLSVNGRAEEPLVDPTVDLATMPLSAPTHSYVRAPRYAGGPATREG